MSATARTRHGDITIPFAPLPHLDVPWSLYEGFRPGSTVLPAGWLARPGYAPLPCAMLRERDVAYTLRDGVTIYMDIYRPLTDAPVPTILGWGPGGKSGMRDMLSAMPDRMRVPKDRLSGLQGWECADPADWVPYDYATVQVDPRGCFMSEGDVQYFGLTDAEDAAEVIEWLGTREWSNGRIGFSGNSWYGMVQWSTAALRPAHLAAIAPWEGQDDLYREEYVKGGIPMPPFSGARCWSNGGRIEDIFEMTRTHPLYDEYWASKRPAIEQIEVPAYVVASYSSWTHSQGTFGAWERLPVELAWLRVHATAEWPDYYDRENLTDLRRFFDRYLKDDDNGWEHTPRIRITTLDPGREPLEVHEIAAFPPADTQKVELFLDARAGSLSRLPVEEGAAVSYAADDPDAFASFTLPVAEDFELIGFPSLRFWVSAEDADDMDLYVRVGKLDADGVPLQHDAIGEWFFGPFAQLRVSHRELDATASTPDRPRQHHTSEQLLEPDQVVLVELALSPISMMFRAGERIELRIAGRRLDQVLKVPDFTPEEAAAAALMFAMDPDAAPSPAPSTSRNRGRHVIHSGGGHPSRLLLPVRFS